MWGECWQAAGALSSHCWLSSNNLSFERGWAFYVLAPGGGVYLIFFYEWKLHTSKHFTGWNTPLRKTIVRTLSLENLYIYIYTHTYFRFFCWLTLWLQKSTMIHSKTHVHVHISFHNITSETVSLGICIQMFCFDRITLWKRCLFTTRC